MMLSRIADSLFWIGRYMERADNTERILDVNYHMLLEQPPDTYKLRWDPLIMKFCEFFGGAENLRPSRLAAGWRMPHAQPAA